MGRSSTGQQTFLSNLSARWARTLSRRTSFEVGVGLAVIDNPPVEAATGAVPAAPAPAVFLLTPTVSASLSHAEQLGGSPIRFTLAGSVEPAVDPLTGSGYLRSSGTATVTWTPARMVTVAGSASGAKAVSTTLPHEWAARTDLSASFLGPRLTRFVIGGRWSWLPFVWAGAAPGSALPSLTGGAQWGAYCAVDFLAHSAL